MGTIPHYLNVVVEIIDDAGRKPALSEGAVKIISDMYYDAVANALWHRDHCDICGEPIHICPNHNCQTIQYNPNTGEMW